MSTAKPSRLPGELRKVIDHYRRRWRAVTVETGFFVTLGVLACTVGLAIAADRLLRLTPQFRTVTLITILSLGGLCLVRRVLWPAVRRLRDREAAARLGHSFPKVEEDLVSAVELSSEAYRENEQGISQGLLRSALGQIVERTRAVDYRRAVPVRPLLKAGVAALAVLAVLFGAYEIRPDAIWNALDRIFRPAASVPYYSYTRLQVAPGDCIVRVGDSVDVAVATGGRLASSARLEGRKGDGAAAADRFSVRLTCEQGTARWSSGPLFRDIAYRVGAGDALSDWFHVRVLPPPSLSQKSATVRSPSYAGSRLQTIEKVDGPLQAVEGSEVAIRVAVAHRGDDPRLQCTGEMRQGSQTWPLAPAGPGILASPAFRPTVSGEYVITLIDGFGLRNRTPESVFIRVVPDRVPVVAITRPGRDLLLLPGETFAIEANARDEFGIRSLDLSYRVIRAKPQEGEEETAERWERRVLKEGGPAAAELAARIEVGMDDLGMVPGDNLEYKAEASDYLDEAVLRRGASPLYRVTVLSQMEHIERILARLKELQLELLRRAAGEKAQAAKAEKLAEASEKAAVREESRAAQNAELDHARATEQLARQLDGLIPELARNPITPTDMLAQMERLGRGTRSVAQEPMQQAAQKFGQAADSPQTPSPSLQSAQQKASDAQRRLEQFAQLAQRMQRNAILERLAAQAEALATRERELKDNLAAPLAIDTAGAGLKDLSCSQKARLQRIVLAQKDIRDGIRALGKDIEKAAADLAFSSPTDAATATEAKGKLDEDTTAERAGAIDRQFAGGVIFSQLPEQEEVAKSLVAVADILRRRTIGEELEAIAKELEEFIRRQREINGNIQIAINKEDKAPRPNELGSSQSGLQRDVTEQASALHWLAREIAAFQSATADKLDAAAKEMGEGAADLYSKALPEGLDHGKKALALLEDAREQFKNDSQQMQKAAQDAQMIQALLLLQRVIVGQKRVNSATARADELRVQASKDFDHVVVDVAARQSEVRGGAKKLQKLLERFRDAAAIVGESGKRMDTSRLALGAGDTGTDVRTVQREALALLEALLKDQQGGGGGGGGARIQAILGMMGGSGGGGFTGGNNAPVMPATLGDAKDDAWRRVHSRFDEQLGAAFEARFPAEYRALLNAYFERLRKEPAK